MHLNQDQPFEFRVVGRALYVRVAGLGTLWLSPREVFFDGWATEQRMNGPDWVARRRAVPESQFVSRLAGYSALPTEPAADRPVVG
jgi:hypothetical protein